MSCQQVHVPGRRDGAKDPRGFLHRETLAGKELGPAVGELDDHIGAIAARRLQDRVYRIGAHDIDCRKGIFLFFAII